MRVKAAPAKKKSSKPASGSNGHNKKALAKQPAKAEPRRKSAGYEHETAHLFKAGEVTATKPIIYVNGRMVPKSQAMVSVYDHGLLYGDGVFEGIRIYKGQIFKCGQHMDRLWRCAEMIRLRIPVSRDDMVTIMRDCVEANNLKDGYIRLVVTRGFGTLGLDPRKCPVAGVICIADQIALYTQRQEHAPRGGQDRRRGLPHRLGGGDHRRHADRRHQDRPRR